MNAETEKQIFHKSLMTNKIVSDKGFCVYEINRTRLRYETKNRSVDIYFEFGGLKNQILIWMEGVKNWETSSGKVPVTFPEKVELSEDLKAAFNFEGMEAVFMDFRL